MSNFSDIIDHYRVIRKHSNVSLPWWPVSRFVELARFARPPIYAILPIWTVWALWWSGNHRRTSWASRGRRRSPWATSNDVWTVATHNRMSGIRPSSQNAWPQRWWSGRRCGRWSPPARRTAHPQLSDTRPRCVRPLPSRLSHVLHLRIRPTAANRTTDSGTTATDRCRAHSASGSAHLSHGGSDLYRPTSCEISFSIPVPWFSTGKQDRTD